VVFDTYLFALLVFVWVWWCSILTYLPCLCLFGCGGVRHILRSVFLRPLCPVLPVSLDCLFFIALPVFSNT
jgi:hypothetical protein